MNKPLALDASAMLALIYAEPGGNAVSSRLRDGSVILVSAVNLCETATKLTAADWTPSEVTMGLAPFVDHCVEFDCLQALVAAEISKVTARIGMSLGDRACLALAVSRKATVLTSDRAWKKLKLDLEIELIR